MCPGQEDLLYSKIIIILFGLLLRIFKDLLFSYLNFLMYLQFILA